MATSRVYHKECNFMEVSLAGCITDASLLQHIIDLNSAYAGGEGILEIADCRSITDISSVSVEGTSICAEHELIKPGSRLVILIPEDDVMLNVLAGIYEASALPFREAVIVTTSLEEAVEWLTDDESRRQQILEIYQ